MQRLEEAQRWDKAIIFLQRVIKENPESIDAYIFMEYLLMNLLVEEDYDQTKGLYYAHLLKKYFEEACEKFRVDQKFLYFGGRIALIGECFVDREVEDCYAMLEEANRLEPNNLLYKEIYFWQVHRKNKCDPELISYARALTGSDSPLAPILADMGAVGNYLLRVTKFWCECVLYECSIDTN